MRYVCNMNHKSYVLYFVYLEETFLDFVSLSQLRSKIFICEISEAKEYSPSSRSSAVTFSPSPRQQGLKISTPSISLLHFHLIPFPPVWVVSTLNQSKVSYPGVWLAANCSHGNHIRSFVSRLITVCNSAALECTGVCIM